MSSEEDDEMTTAAAPAAGEGVINVRKIIKLSWLAVNKCRLQVF